MQCNLFFVSSCDPVKTYQVKIPQWRWVDWRKAESVESLNWPISSYREESICDLSLLSKGQCCTTAIPWSRQICMWYIPNFNPTHCSFHQTSIHDQLTRKYLNSTWYPQRLTRITLVLMNFFSLISLQDQPFF